MDYKKRITYGRNPNLFFALPLKPFIRCFKHAENFHQDIIKLFWKFSIELKDQFATY